MGGDELRWSFAFLGLANTSLQMPFEVVDADAMAQARGIVDATHAVEFTDKKVALVIETNAVRAVNVVPHGDQLAVGVEYLDAMGLPISDVDIVILVDDHIVRSDELTRIDAWGAPGEQVPPLGGEFMHAAVAIAVRDVQMPRDRRHRHVGRAIERIALPFGGRTVGTAQGHEQLPVQRELLDRVQPIVHTVDHIVRTNMDAVRPCAEQTLAPGAQKIALAVKDDYRVLAAVEDIDVVLRVNRHPGHIDELPAGRKFFPIFHRGKEQHATTDDGGHRRSPFLQMQRHFW